ncbi:MAG: C69 family dipeptidase [Longimicrobiales bacterium]
MRFFPIDGLRASRRRGAGALFVLLAAVAIAAAAHPLIDSTPAPDVAADAGCAADQPCSCTSIMVGAAATTDGSVITSHTCDGNYRTWIDVRPARENGPGAMNEVVTGRLHNAYPGDRRGVEVRGSIPESPRSHAFINTAYPAMNEHQVGIGETTWGGRRELRSENGLFLIEELERLMLERATTAREAIAIADSLTAEHGYIDVGECLTVIDPTEVWQLEIIGPGEGRTGAVWVAARIPDDHVAVSANIPRIGEVELDDPDRFLASANLYSRAEELGLWDPASGEPFKFWQVYGGRDANHARREWRVLSLAAPSLGLDPEAPELPLSVKAERKLGPRDVMAMFRDTYEGTPYDPIGNLVVKDREGVERVSPEATPWMSRSEMALLNALEPGVVPRERTIAVSRCAYSTVIQARGWLPDPIGGIVWFGLDNPATTARIPLFAGITDVPPSFKRCDQHGFTTESAGWAFRRASRLAEVEWGSTRDEVMAVVMALEDRAFAELPDVEERALALYDVSPDSARAYLTTYSSDFARAAEQRYWELGDRFWARFARGF